MKNQLSAVVLLALVSLPTMASSIETSDQWKVVAKEACETFNMPNFPNTYLRTTYDLCQSFILIHKDEFKKDASLITEKFGKDLSRPIKGSRLFLNYREDNAYIEMSMLQQDYEHTQWCGSDFPSHAHESFAVGDAKNDFSLRDYAINMGVCFRKIKN